MKKLIKTLSIALLALTSTLSAHLTSEPCSFTFGAEYLYMQNATDQPYFVVDLNPNTTGTPGGTKYANRQEWHSGYRLEGSYQLDCLSDICVRWTHFPNFSDSRTVTSADGALRPTLGTTTGSTSFASIKDEYKFYTLEALYEYAFINSCPVSLTFFGGLQYNHLQYDRNVSYLIGVAPNVLEYKSKRDNIGIELGTEFEWAFTECLSFDMRGSSSLLASYRRPRFSQVNLAVPAGAATVNEENNWMLIPAVNFRAGFSYDYCLFSGILNLGVGYEFIAYFNGIDTLFNTGAQSSLSFDLYHHFMLQGLYVHADYTF